MRYQGSILLFVLLYNQNDLQLPRDATIIAFCLFVSVLFRNTHPASVKTLVALDSQPNEFTDFLLQLFFFFFLGIPLSVCLTSSVAMTIRSLSLTPPPPSRILVIVHLVFGIQHIRWGRITLQEKHS